MKFWNLAGLAALCLLSALATPAAAQGTNQFTLTTGPLNPPAVAPGGTSSVNISVGSVNGFTGSVALSCQVTSNQTTDPAGDPVCNVSPSSVTPSATATATITTNAQTTTVGYTITITGTASASYSAPTLDLTVLAVAPQFTITIDTLVQPSSVPAGSGAQGTILVNPTNGYTTPQTCNAGQGAGPCGITLYCATVTPLVTIPPYCSFSYNGGTSIDIVGGVAQTATLTITTQGPVPTGAAAHPRPFYAFWIPLPLLGLLGLGAACGGKKSRTAFGMLALFVVTGSLLLLPACANNPNSTTTPNGVTPANTYTFTIVGVDGNGVVSSNTGSGSTATSVSLTVTAPPK